MNPVVRSNVLLVEGLRVHIIPKIASTAIQNSLAPLRYQHRSPGEAGGEYRVMVVRHPLERLVSCWSYFCDAEHGRKRLASNLGEFGVRPCMSFEGFLQCVLPRHQEDRHTAPQVDFAGPHPMDELIAIEDLPEGWQLLRERIRGLPALPVANATEHGRWEDYYSPSMREAALGHFEQDLDLYNRAQAH